ncbi:MAG: M15 family metallopeptidase [Tahibacter sp.]
MRPRLTLPKPPHDLSPPQTADRGLREKLHAAALKLGIPPNYGRQRGMRRIAEPSQLAFVGYDLNERPQWMLPRAAQAWLAMRHNAAADMVELQLVSAFRSIEYQLGLVERKLQRGQALQEVLRVSAAPGYSEHHSGRALDVTTPGSRPLEEEFEGTSAFAWLNRHAVRFGFRLSFPRDNPHSIAYEPWHWCWHRPG